MKKLKRAHLAVALLLTVIALPSVATAAPATGSWSGWITDSHCGAKGAKAGHKDCAEKCVKGGSTLELYNSADQKIYHLDDQAAATANLDHEVTVTGTLEGDTIKVASIAPKAE